MNKNEMAALLSNAKLFRNMVFLSSYESLKENQ